MKQKTPEQHLVAAKKDIENLKTQNKALYTAMGKMERKIRAVELRARRAETNARNNTTTISALKRKLGIRE